MPWWDGRVSDLGSDPMAMVGVPTTGNPVAVFTETAITSLACTLVGLRFDYVVEALRLQRRSDEVGL